MSTRTEKLARVIRCHDLSPGSRLLVWEMSQWLSDDEDVCVRSQIQLAANLGVHRNSVIRWLHELADKGVVSSVPCGNINAYTLHLDAVTVGV
jgi:hypothetical protein